MRLRTSRYIPITNPQSSSKGMYTPAMWNAVLKSIWHLLHYRAPPGSCCSRAASNERRRNDGTRTYRGRG